MALTRLLQNIRTIPQRETHVRPDGSPNSTYDPKTSYILKETRGFLEVSSLADQVGELLREGWREAFTGTDFQELRQWLGVVQSQEPCLPREYTVVLFRWLRARGHSVVYGAATKKDPKDKFPVPQDPFSRLADAIEKEHAGHRNDYYPSGWYDVNTCVPGGTIRQAIARGAQIRFKGTKKKRLYSFTDVQKHFGNGSSILRRRIK